MVQLLVSTIKNDGLDGQTGFFAQEREGMDTVEALSTWSQGRQDQQEDSRPFGFFFFGSIFVKSVIKLLQYSTVVDFVSWIPRLTTWDL